MSNSTNQPGPSLPPKAAAEAQSNEDNLRALIQSTLDFYARFNLQPELPTALRVFREEVDELIEAAQLGTNLDHIAEEAADVFVTAIGICLARGVTLEEILHQTQMVIRKNNAKTHETHAINEYGKIARKKTR